MDEVSPFEPTVVTAVRRHWRLVVVIIVICTVPAAFYGFTRAASYKATASLTVSDPRGPGVLAGQNTEPPDRYVSDQIPVFRSLALGQRAAERGLEQRPPLRHSASWFLSHISAFATAADNNLLSVSFSAPTAALAMAGVRATVKIGDLSGDVRTLSDGRYIETQVRHGGWMYNDQGITAVVETERQHTIVLTSRRMAPNGSAEPRENQAVSARTPRSTCVFTKCRHK